MVGLHMERESWDWAALDALTSANFSGDLPDIPSAHDTSAGTEHGAEDTAVSKSTQVAPASSDDIVMHGILEKKPVEGIGMVERGLGGGWRKRRVVLRPSCIEWHQEGGDCSDPSRLRLDPFAKVHLWCML